MSIHIKEVLPLLEKISKQQRSTSERLAKLINTFKHVPEPVEPVLRSMLKPLRDSMDDIEETLQSTSSPPI